jgi:putative transposase
MRSEVEQSYLMQLIEDIRSDHPTMSCRAMYHKIQPGTIGRDKFEALCKQWGYSSIRPVNYQRTTDSKGVIRFDNLLEKAQITGMNQAYVSDITYFELNNRFYYITFIMDAFTRYIVGYAVSDRLLTESTTLLALKMALKNRKGELPKLIIFHSDGGGQYFDKIFLQLTKKYDFLNSMCEFAYQNGKAERINGVIKNNYLKHWEIKTYKDLVSNVDRAVHLYNTGKPHKELKMKTPLQIEKEQLNLQQQTKPKMTESFDAKSQLVRGIEPLPIEANKASESRCIFHKILSEG